jgi:hypothetical protein
MVELISRNPAVQRKPSPKLTNRILTDTPLIRLYDLN